jgi:hypothetical protein
LSVYSSLGYERFDGSDAALIGGGYLREASAPAYKWQKGNIVMVLKDPIHGGYLVVYGHHESVLRKRKVGVAFSYQGDDVRHAHFISNEDLDVIGLGHLALNTQEAHRYGH